MELNLINIKKKEIRRNREELVKDKLIGLSDKGKIL